MSRPLLSLVILLSVDACTCGKAPTKPTLRAETEVCTNDDECDTGLCDAPNGQQPVCVRKCSAGCRADEVCTQLNPGRFACQQDPHGLCRPCRVDTDCPYPSDRCLMVDGQGVCGRDCAFDMACPTSYRCVNGVGTDGHAKALQCSPTSGSCSCTAASAGQTIGCEVKNTVGTCTGVRTCDGVMGYGACEARTPAAESCNGVDDDCDGLTDEDQPMVTCGVGACEVRVPSCGDAGVLACTPKDAGVERCNNLDDDCNGVVDNGFDLATDVQNCGVCGRVCVLPNAQPRCDARACIVGTCNSGWGNCDGVQSNGCEVDLNTDVNNCGACNRQCSAAGGTPTCTNGMCGFSCSPGFVDLDGNPANGCEYACTFTSAIDEPDVDFIDANCDGMDGELLNGVYVSSALGDDSNQGTSTAPKRTIAEGIRAAMTQGKRDVYVSAGLHTGPLTMTGTRGINVAGGYAPSTPRWSRSSINTTIVAGGNPALFIADAGSSLVQFITFRGDDATGTESNGAGRTAYGAKVVNSTLKLELLTVIAGNGVAGADGSTGTTGLGGLNGGPGANGVQNDNFVLCASGASPVPGSAGGSFCGRTGGAGGLAGLAYNNGVASIGSNGATGVGPTAAGTGGPPYRDTSGAYSTPLSTQNGTAGARGMDGVTPAAAPRFGVFSVAGYLPAVGASGGDGTHGNGGGGGGGGGGGCQDLVVGGFLQFCYCYSFGSTGGGGGGGGCGATGGGGGRSGGASVALMLFDARVTQQRLRLQSSRGGDGGRGGSGGQGGSFGDGGSSVHVWTSQGYAGIGGRGGNGGAGGSGGHGAGGVGGHSFGVARNAGSSLNVTGISFTLGSAALGGTSPGNAGQAGVVEADHVF